MRVELIFLGLCVLIAIALCIGGCGSMGPVAKTQGLPLPVITTASSPDCYKFNPSPTSAVYYVFDDNQSAGVSENSCEDAERALKDVPTIMCSHLDDGELAYMGTDGKYSIDDTCVQAWIDWVNAAYPDSKSYTMLQA